MIIKSGCTVPPGYKRNYLGQCGDSESLLICSVPWSRWELCSVVVIIESFKVFFPSAREFVAGILILDCHVNLITILITPFLLSWCLLFQFIALYSIKIQGWEIRQMCAAAFSFDYIMVSKNSSKTVSAVLISLMLFVDEVSGQAELTEITLLAPR